MERPSGKVRYYKELNIHGDASFYEGEEQLLLGVLEWIKRHVDYTRGLAENAAEEELRIHYTKVADCNEWLLENPPRTLREACQFTAHFQCIDRMYYAGGALGQMDELFRPYYEKDKESFGLTDEEAVWYLPACSLTTPIIPRLAGLRLPGIRTWQAASAS